ncbi:transcription-associated protein 1, partial [Elasticomyces elasticus]
MAERGLEVYEAKLQDPTIDTKTKCAITTEIRDGMDHWCQSSTYGIFLQKLVPIFLSILGEKPVFISTLPEQRLRSCVLEILHRLPMNMPEATDPHAKAIVEMCMGLARKENEDNAVLCMKIIMDFERHHAATLSGQVQPFLDLILELFDSMEATVEESFEMPAPTSHSGLPSTPSHSQISQSPRPASPVASTSSLTSDSDQQARQIPRGMQSFKVVAECPIIVVSLFQSHRSIVPKNVKPFIDRIQVVLALQAQPQREARRNAAERGETHYGVAKDIRNRAAFGELITAQVKTMSFLAYLLRVYAQQMQQFLPNLPDIVVRLLQDCPKEKSSARKELLVAIRHIINFNFRTIFLPKLDELLDERTLIGDGLTVYETLRPLAYSMLADLIHHVRDKLTSNQIRKTVVVYTRNLHDDYPGTSFQTMSAKLLINMAECMAKVENKQDARHFLIMVLNAIGDKFASMNRHYHNAVKTSAQNVDQTIDATPENYLADKDQPPDWDEFDIFTATPINISNPRERGSDPVADNKFLFKNLLHGLKTLFYQLRASNPDNIGEEIDQAVVPANWQEVSFGYSAEEVNVLIKLLREGAGVFRYYHLEKPSTDTQATSPVEFLAQHHMMSSGKEEKDLLETFATIFHHIDPATFHEIFQSEIPHLYEMMFDHSALLHVPQFLLASEATSPAFAGMLLQFLMAKIEEVGTADVQKSSILLRLYKLSFMAVTLFSAQNEQVLLPHVTKLITKSIQLSVTAEEPNNYFLLLRSLFRSIGGGRFEHLYKEILPLLEMLLEVLNNLLISARKPSERDLFVELSLTVPARLSHLLPHLNYLMRPLVVALRAGSELIAQGLRTLELCVDNLTADYLDPIMAPVIDDLMAALWDHLKPNPYSHFHSHTTLRILGKLGGRNRKFLTRPPELTYQPYSDDEASFDIRLIGSTKERAFPARLGIDVAIDKLKEVPKAGTPAQKSDAFHKLQAFRLISAHVKLLVGADSLPDDFAQLVRLQANDLVDNKFDVGVDLLTKSEREKSGPKKDAEQEKLLKLLKACVFAATLPDLKDEASAFLKNLYRHFTILDLGSALAHEKHHRRPFDVNSGEGSVVIDSTVMADVIAQALSSDHVLVREVAENAMLSIREAAATIFGSIEKVERLAFFSHLARTLMHCCYEEEWFTKAGGTYGIEVLINKLGLSDEWLIEKQHDLVRALLYVMKDMPQDLPAGNRIQAKETLLVLIRKCDRHYSKEDVKNHQSKLHSLCGRLIVEVSHMNRHVREAAQSSLGLLAEVVGVKLQELVQPVKDPLLLPIFGKPLRALPFATQIGYIDAVTFCLNIEPAEKDQPNGIIDFDDQLTRLLMETLALADAEDENLAAKPSEQRNAENIVNLRVACLGLLSTAIGLPAFALSQMNQNRPRIISVFFRSLYSKNTEVAKAANKGLEIVLKSTNKLPKDLLQNGLRPILMNVQDPKKLSVEGLEGLRTLLQLLTNYFKVEIGSRLLDHMKQIADVPSLQKVSFTLVEQNPRMKIVTAIFSVFHLLPTAAVQFLGTLVDRVLELERGLRRTQRSPFRDPLIKYLNHYPKESWAYFSSAIKNTAKGRLFAQLLEDPSSGPLRDIVAREAAVFADTFTTAGGDAEKSQAAINGIHVAYALSIHSETGAWLVPHERCRRALFEAAKDLESSLNNNTIAPNLRLAAEQAAELIMTVLTTYLSHEPEDLDFFFEIVEAITMDQLRFCPSLIDFIYKRIISSDSVEYQKSVLLRCIDVYTNRQTSQRTKTFAFHYILNPTFAMDVMRNWEKLFDGTKGTALLDKSLTDAVHNKLWKPQSLSDISDDGSQTGVDQSRMELLQTTALLVKYHHPMLQDARKDIIKFGWNYIKLDDVINKYAAYALIAYFIASYETPAKIASQVYQALLRAHQGEGRALVMQSLEILEPTLKKRIGGPDPRMPLWARIPRRILSEETSNLQQLTSIYHFLVRHPDLFYEAREQFVQIIVPSLNKVATLPNPSVENKKLALHLFTLIWQWEERTVRENGSLSAPSASTPNGTAPGTPVKANKRLAVASPSARLALIKYMVQFIATLSDRFPVPSAGSKDATSTQTNNPSQSFEIIQKSLTLMYKFLSAPYWDDLDVDNMFPKITEQVLMSDPKTDDKPEIWITRTVNTLQIVRVLLNAKPNEWVLARLPQLTKLLAKPLRNENPEIQDCLHSSEGGGNDFPKMQSLVARALLAVPDASVDEEMPDADSPTEEFINSLSSLATDAMAANNLISGINVLWSLLPRRPKLIDTHVPTILKAFQTKLAKDHLASHVPPQVAMMARPGEPAPTPPTAQEAEITVDLSIKVMQMLSARITVLNENRRPYLSVLASLVERSQNNTLCLNILQMVEKWIFDHNETVPTLKEKTAVLQKMLLFEHRPDQTLYTKFLELVIRIYEDPEIFRSELSVRMEHAFLIGLRAQDIEMRTRFMTIFDRSHSRTTSSRLYKLIADQHWDVLADSFWLSQVIHMMFGSIDMNAPARLHADDFRCMQASKVFGTYAGDQRTSGLLLDEEFEQFIAGHRKFCAELGSVRSRDVLEPMCYLQHTDSQLAHDVWVAYFPVCWSILSKDDREDIERGLVNLITKEFHQRQMDRRPNCVETLLEGIVRCKPRCKFPPHVMTWVAKTYNAWYTAACALEQSAIEPILDTPATRESNLDALVEIYAQLEESDLFYGTWRRRAQFIETNSALSYEQNGIWDKAQSMYEQAQIKARTGSLPFAQGEYMLWEDHWVLCAQKLQQWDILGDFAKHENLNDLYLESTWRNYEAWTTPENQEQLDTIIKAVSDAPTPRRMFFQAFISLLKLHSKNENQADFNRICDENIQLSIKNWHRLSKRITNGHITLLQNFQQVVELHDASVICQSLALTTAQNLDQKSQELKLLLVAWRDRLPNFWDDINAWQDLVTWRQHIFQLINATYLTLVPQNQGNATTNSYAYRGYHETAWIINRFAHVARKHQMPEVCNAQLSRIYTLPNIEIQEAFLKLREQAKCHYQNPAELTSGLDVINNTNLNYFTQQQKAEFYTLKGMFLAKLGQNDDANTAFGSALFFEIKLPKAWAEWGRYHDNLFKQEPGNLERATAGVNCYLEAAGQYKNAKSRKLLSRVLWLLSLDDAQGQVAKAFEDYRGETPVWYWITFIPQLLNNLSRTAGEARIARELLAKLAKTYPQALYFQLRTSREDMHAIKKVQEAKEQKERAVRQAAEAAKQGSPASRPQSAHIASRPPTANGEPPPSHDGTSLSSENVTPKVENSDQNHNMQDGDQQLVQPTPKKPWEYTEDVMQILKTAYPLLALSMETMVDQIQKYFKCPPDEDAYRLIVALLNDGLSYVGRLPASYGQDVKLPPGTEANITCFAESVLPPHIRKYFELDFVTKKPTMFEYIQKLKRWRDRFEEKLDRRIPIWYLEGHSSHLSDFRFVKFDEVEIPGQYLQHRDKNQDFIRIERFLPNVDLIRGIGACHRRLKIRGHDGSVHPFAIQHPALRHGRREERVMQLFRMLNSTLAKKKESRRRNLQFHLPVIVPLSPHIRMIQDDASYISLQGIYEDYCRKNEINKDDAILYTMDKIRALGPVSDDICNAESSAADIKISQQHQDQVASVRLETYYAIQEKYVPTHIVHDYFRDIYPSFSDLWLFRRQFSYQLAALTFMTFTMHMTIRYP